MRSEEPQPTTGDAVCAEHSGSKGVNLETKNSKSYGGRSVPNEKRQQAAQQATRRPAAKGHGKPTAKEKILCYN
jgi:hypothetical protein